MAMTEIRHARREDMNEIEQIFLSYEPAYDWHFARKYYEDFFGSPERHRGDAVLVGVSEGRVVGVVGLKSDWYEVNDIFWVGWFYVHKDVRGQAHGARLLDRVIREAKQRGGRKLYTDTSSFAFYKGAHHRYKALGFKLEAKLKDYYEEGEDQIIYALDLT